MADQTGIQPLIWDMDVNGNLFTVNAALLWDVGSHPR
ncbi:hypothetical protein J2X61_001324 [Bacillus sp. 3255]|nr:hypothetical protein [Bacillus sp. 3255]